MCGWELHACMGDNCRHWYIQGARQMAWSPLEALQIGRPHVWAVFIPCSWWCPGSQEELGCMQGVEGGGRRARGDWPSGEADPQQCLLVPTFSSTSWGGSMAESLCFRHAPLPIAHPDWSVSLWKDRVCQEPLQAAPGVEGGQHSHLSGQNDWVQAGVPWCFDLGRRAGSRFSSPTSGKAPRKIWQPHRVCHSPGWDMLLHKVFVPNPNGRDNQLHHSQSHILGGEWLAEQVSESCCGAMATTTSMMILESCQAASPICMCQCFLTTCLWQCPVSGRKNDKLQLLGGLWKRVQVTVLIFPTRITAIWLSVSFPQPTESLNLTYPTSRHASSVLESTVAKYALFSAQICLHGDGLVAAGAAVFWQVGRATLGFLCGSGHLVRYTGTVVAPLGSPYMSSRVAPAVLARTYSGTYKLVPSNSQCAHAFSVR